MFSDEAELADGDLEGLVSGAPVAILPSGTHLTVHQEVCSVRWLLAAAGGVTVTAHFHLATGEEGLGELKDLGLG